MKRRSFIRSSLFAGGMVVAASAGVLAPARVWARNWPDHILRSSNEAEIRKALFGELIPITGDAVTLGVPRQGNLHGIGVVVSTDLQHVDTIALVVADNPQPLCSVVALSESTQGFFKTRIRLQKSSIVTAYVKAKDKLYVASANVKISTGGYGIGHQ